MHHNITNGAFVMSQIAPPIAPDFAVSTPTDRLIEMWLHGRSRHTQDSYRRFARRFLGYARKPVDAITLADVQGWQDTLGELSPNSQRTALAAVKSLLSFGHKIGVLACNTSIPVKAPPAKDTLNERLLSELEVQLMIRLEVNPRNRTILRLLYAGGLRVSELCQMKWKDIKERRETAQITVFGKGGKTRSVLLPTAVWVELEQLRGDADFSDPVFSSRKSSNGGHLNRSQIFRLVSAAASRAGIRGKVSPHWLRHAHASHSLDRGAPIHLVQQTLGHASVATTSRYLHARPNDSSSLYLPS